MRNDSLAAEAAALDAADPLADYRAHFYQPADGSIYLDGNSLGLLSREAEAAVLRALDQWKTHAVGGWLDAGWFDLAERLAARVAPLVGAAADEVAVTNSTTVNLHQLLATLYRPNRGHVGEQHHAWNKILAFAGEFPSDLYALASHLRGHGVDPAEGLHLLPAGRAGLLDEAAVEAAFADPKLGIQLAVLPAVVYTTGQLLDLPRLVAAARRANVTIGFDLSHSVGAVPHALGDPETGPDFAFWCHYKYLNAGPGAAGGLFLHRRRHGAHPPGLAGWWGSCKERQFDMAREQTPARGAASLQVGTPPILALAALEGTLEIHAAAGMAALRAKSLAQTDFLMRVAEAELPFANSDSGFRFANPREGQRRGGHVALVHPAAGQLCRALKTAGVVTDFRPPDILRLAPAPLYNTFAECRESIARLREIVATGAHATHSAARALVP